MTFWVLVLLVGTNMSIQDFDVYRTQEACQAQIDSMPQQDQRSILGGKITCKRVTLHDN